MRELYERYKDIIPYAVFGVLTTAINIASYWLLAHVFNAGTMAATVAAWVIAVLFAYVTNRKWVFHSDANTTSLIFKEIVSFFACRLATGVVDWGIMFIFVQNLHLNDVVIKTLANVIVIILNYVVSKRYVFGEAKK